MSFERSRRRARSADGSFAARQVRDGVTIGQAAVPKGGLDVLLDIANAQTADSPPTRRPADASSVRSSRPPGHGGPGGIGPGDVLAAQTALAALTRVLAERGLRAEQTDSNVLSVHQAAERHAEQTGQQPSPVPCQVVVLAARPDDRNRLWWWLPTSAAGGASGDLRPCVRATDICGTADRIARLLAVSAGEGR